MNRIGLSILMPLVLAAQQGAAIGSGQQKPGVPPATNTEDLCIIEGQVVSSVTGEILKNATLTLRRDGTSPATAGLPKKYGAATDVTGKFVFANVAPGNYILSATRPGFVDAEYGARNPNGSGTTISLDAGKHLSDVVFRMIPHAVLTGRITGEDGDLLAAVEVYALYYRYPQGRKRMASYDSATTNDRGEYRIFGLAPGRYYLCATAPADQAPQKPAATPGQASKGQYVNTFYPRVTELAAAVPVDVGPGVELSGMNIEFSRHPVVSVRGRVADASGSGLKKLMVYLMPREAVAFALTRNTSTIDKQGNFEIDGVIPGSYTLVATMWDQEKSLASRLPLEVGKNDIEGIGVTLSPVMSVSGRIRVESPTDGSQANAGNQSPINLTKVEVGLDARDPNAQRFIWVPPATVKEDNSFILSDVTPETYNVTLSGVPEGLYFKSVRLNGEDRLATGLTLSSAGDVIEIVLSPNAGQAAGLVQNDKEQPTPGVTVVLVPQEKERREQRRYYQTTTTDAAGRFVFKSLDPGKYKAYVWEYVDPGKYMDPDFMQPLEDRGTPLTIREGSREDLQLKLIG